MNKRHGLVSALALVAGLALSAHAQDQDRKTSSDPSRGTPGARHAEPRDAEARLSSCDFRSFKWLTGLDVFNPAGEHVADVSDLIVNRGSGRIDSVVLTTGTTLGLGGKMIAMPFSVLRWDGAKERFVLDATEEQLKSYPEFSKENWAGLTDPDSKKPNALREWMRRDQPDYRTDPFAGSLQNARKESIEGEVTKIERVDSGTGEQLVATVRDSSGASHRVWLGPSWFVNGSAYAPMRGDKVVIDAYSLDRSPDNALVGRSMKISGNELAFRNDTGGPLWAVPQGTPPKRDNQSLDEAAFASPTWRSLLASELSDRKVVCRGQESGKVNDLIIDRPSGQIAMLSIDPNENFLGIADTKRLVPWGVATVAVDGTLRIDASKEMVLASPDTPSDLAKLNNGATARMVYKAYDVDVPAFREAQAASRDGWNSTDDRWRSTGPILNGIASGPSQTVEGQVVEFTRVDFGDGTSPAKAVRIKTPSGEQTVLLGPAAYADTQPECCTRGKRVSIEAVKVRIDGKEQLLARRVQAEGKNTTLIDSSNKPIWDQP